jgi:hypothetical protein
VPAGRTLDCQPKESKRARAVGVNSTNLARVLSASNVDQKPCDQKFRSRGEFPVTAEHLTPYLISLCSSKVSCLGLRNKKSASRKITQVTASP